MSQGSYLLDELPLLLGSKTFDQGHGFFVVHVLSPFRWILSRLPQALGVGPIPAPPRTSYRTPYFVP